MRSRAGRMAALVTLGLLVAIAEWWPMLVSRGGPTGDGRGFFMQVEIAKAAARFYGEWPFWNAFDCAGIELWDHPEAIIGSPLVLLMTPASTSATLYVWNLVHVAIGFVGMFLLLRTDLKVARTGAFLGACLFADGAWTAAQAAGFHATMLSFLYMPLVFLLWRRAEHDVASAVGAGVVVALMVFDGATYPLPYCLLLLLAETATRAWPLARLRTIVPRAAIAGVVAAGLSAVRLLPLVDRMGQGHRGYLEVDALTSVSSWLAIFTRRSADTDAIFRPHEYPWHEYVTYIGVTGLLLALVGLAVAIRQARWTLAPAGLALLLMLGKFAPWAPWTLLREHVYPFHELRVPSRFRHLLAAFLCIWIALAVDRVPPLVARLRPALARPIRWLLVGLATTTIIDSLLLGSEIVRRRYSDEAPAPVATPSPRFYYGGEGLTPDWMNQPSQNRAFTGCRTSFAFLGAKAPIWTGDVPPAKLAEPGTGTLVSSARTHNTFDFVIDAEAPTRVLLNSAYDRGWQASEGVVRDHDLLLAVDLPPGHHEVHVRYRPRRFVPGLVISVIAGLAVTAFFLSRRFPRVRTP